MAAGAGCHSVVHRHRSVQHCGGGRHGAAGAVLALRVVSGRLWPERTRLEAPAVLFLVSAVIATFISYNQGEALLRFSRILAGLALFTLIVQSSLAEQRWLAAGFIAAALALAVYWPLQNDFSSQPVKSEAIYAAGMWIENHLPDFKLETLTGPAIHPGVASGVLLLAIPMAATLALDAWQCRRRVYSALAGFSALLLLAALLLTSIRGAWLALAAMAGLSLLILVQRRWFFQARQKMAFWGVWIGLGLLAVFYVAITGRFSDLLGAIPDPTGSVMGRSYLWKQGVGLISDYPFTGSGLASFYMLHSTYSLLIHVPYIQHAHNTFIQVWLEQGILGALAVILGSIVVISKAWRALDERKNLLKSPTVLLGWAGMLMLAGNTVQGLVDVTMYIERTLPLYGLALGYAMLIGKPDALELSQAQRTAVKNTASKVRRTTRIAVAGGIALLLIIGGIIYRAPLLGAWYANLGALSQTRQSWPITALRPFHRTPWIRCANRSTSARRKNLPESAGMAAGAAHRFAAPERNCFEPGRLPGCIGVDANRLGCLLPG